MASRLSQFHGSKTKPQVLRTLFFLFSSSGFPLFTFVLIQCFHLFYIVRRKHESAIFSSTQVYSKPQRCLLTATFKHLDWTSLCKPCHNNNSTEERGNRTTRLYKLQVSPFYTLPVLIVNIFLIYSFLLTDEHTNVHLEHQLSPISHRCSYSCKRFAAEVKNEHPLLNLFIRIIDIHFYSIPKEISLDVGINTQVTST